MVRLLACIAALLALAPWGPALASGRTAQSDEPIEEIVVTGSRLDIALHDMPAPVLVIRAEDIAVSGANTIAELARYLSFNNGVPNDAALQLTPIAGTSHFNLRGIGSQNTLVLVNGERVSPYGASQTNGQIIVDVNAIPLNAIERIEVLKDGASAVYGSDAIAGVVNIVLKRHGNGLGLTTGVLSDVAGNSEEIMLDANWGTSIGETDLLAAASFLKRGALRSRERDFLADGDLRRTGGFNNRSNFSSPVSALRLPINEVHADPECPDDESNPLVFLEPFPRFNPVLKSFCKFNSNRFTDALPASRRLGVTLTVDHEFPNRFAVSAEVLASRAKTTIGLAPAPTDKSPDGTNFPTVAADHPSNPFGESLGLMYRVIDAGPRSRRVVSDAGRAVFRVVRTGTDWDLDVSVLAAYSAASITDFNVVDAALFQDALLGVGGADGTGYYDPFGLEPRNDRDVIAAFTVDATTRKDVFRERSIDMSAQRDIGKLPGGSARIVVGGQLREQKGYGVADAFQLEHSALGLDLLQPFAADRLIRAAFAELSLPLAEFVEVLAAVRHESYDDFGDATNPKLAALWRIADGLELRTSWGTSFRAPSFSELYRGPRESLSFVRDTHRCDITGAPLDCSRYPYRTLSGGNPDLQPEKGESIYVGLRLGRTNTDDWSVDVAWWQIRHSDRIIEPDAPFILEHFGADPEFVIRSGPVPGDPSGTPGRIERINSRAFNLESVQTRGVDFDAQWRLAPAPVELRIGGTYLDQFRVDDPASLSQDLEMAGTAIVFPLPRVRANASLSWLQETGRWTIATHFTDSYRSPRNLVVDGEETSIPHYIDDYLTFDLQYARPFGPDRSWVVRLGCTNCTDEDPPAYNYTTIGEYLHDPRGAIVYARVEHGWP